MSDIRFYHLEQQSLDQVLPALLTKALNNGHRILVKAANEQEVTRLNDHLWTYAPDSFLPHGAKKDGHAESQPIWITTEDENPNNADVLILTGGTQSDALDKFTLCCEMLNGRNEQEVSNARSRWKTYKDAGHDITYWQQGPNGWEKKSG